QARKLQPMLPGYSGYIPLPWLAYSPDITRKAPVQLNVRFFPFSQATRRGTRRTSLSSRRQMISGSQISEKLISNAKMTNRKKIIEQKPARRPETRQSAWSKKALSGMSPTVKSASWPDLPRVRR
ncbi:hypothetical protein, partial [Acidithiobacillus ferriphilus]|uniref:hypothetical protein n=1 Tax=Acidithiobacillus ferriphilus TaxID=1689834 RepID=UPI00242B55D0